MRPTRLPYTLFALLIATTTSGAQAPAAAPKAPPPIVLAADIGFVSTSGNSNVTTLTGNDEITFTRASWSYKQNFSVVYGKLRDTVQTSKWVVSLRAERSSSSWIGVYGLLKYDKDRFSGIAGREEEGVGAAIKSLTSDTDKLDFELGLSYVQTQAVAVFADHTNAAGRAKGTYRHVFSGNPYVQQLAEYLPNLQNGADWRFNSETSLVAPVSTHLALKVTYVVTYQHLPPAGFGDTDRLFSTSLQISF